jgi:hypothetical protein
MEAAQLVIGAAILDPRYCAQLIKDREGALAAADRLPGAPRHVRLSGRDRQILASIKAESLDEFARGVERLRRTLSPAPVSGPATIEEFLVG